MFVVNGIGFQLCIPLVDTYIKENNRQWVVIIFSILNW